jgi:NosR/NirI family transcriptional regulator, nitrous oxide reductase regulator
MRKVILYLLILFLITGNTALTAQQQRFPKPDFESGYKYPEYQMPLPRAQAWEYIDLAVLIGALFATAYFAIRKHSRKGIVWMSLFSLIYFGFFRKGCICPVGSIQNVSLALFNSGYTIPLSVLLFFIIPLLFALAYGRVFCAGVCPLGSIQELTGFKPVKLPKNIEAILVSLPFIYLGLAVLFASTNSLFFICKYDPFVGIFRLNAPYTMIIFGVLLLIAGIFINRPYCRFLCPYGVLLNIFSRFAGRHLSITPATCTNCRLCEESCPYDAIIPPNVNSGSVKFSMSRKKFMIYILLVPVISAVFALIVYNLSSPLATIHRDVRLAREIRMEKESGVAAASQAAITFKESGESESELFRREIEVIERYKNATPWVGLFLGLSLGISLVSLTTVTEIIEYRPHKGKCYSCGRCFEFCPDELKTLK